MTWVHDTGYGPAYDHCGCAVSIMLDGTESGVSPACGMAEVIGWRAACGCGWRGMQFHPSIEAADVHGGGDRPAVAAEWTAHLHRALPELAVHDLARLLDSTQARLRSAVHAARLAGLSLSEIAVIAAAATGVIPQAGAVDDSSVQLVTRVVFAEAH